MFGYLPHQTVQHLGFTIYGAPVLEFLMAIPYSLHVLWPICFVTWCAKTSRWGTLIAFVNCFGLASFTAVLTELVYPTAPPWYLEKYGLAPANYTLPGDPGGLSRIDTYFQGHFYQDTFSKSLWCLVHSLPSTWDGQLCSRCSSYTQMVFATIIASRWSCSCILFGSALP